jgi:hypothetical protein
LFKISCAALTALLLAGCGPSEAELAARAKAYAAAEQAAHKQKLRSVIERTLIDPYTVQYRNERVTPAGALCGEVNGKNALGDYVGFTRFVVNPMGKGYMAGDPASFEHKVFELDWLAYCLPPRPPAP